MTSFVPFKLPSQILREAETKRVQEETKRLQNLSPDELADLRAAYISADQAASVAYEAYVNAIDNGSISPIERDQFQDEWERLQQKADEMRQSLKIAQEVTQ